MSPYTMSTSSSS